MTNRQHRRPWWQNKPFTARVLTDIELATNAYYTARRTAEAGNQQLAEQYRVLGDRIWIRIEKLYDEEQQEKS